MVRRLGLVVGLACVSGFAACFVDIPAVIPLDGGPIDGAVPSCDASGCGALPTGWFAVFFATDRSVPCPTGTTMLDVVADPGTAPSDTCACDCSVTEVPPCTPQVIDTTFSTTTPPCATLGASLAADGGCNSVFGSLPRYTAILPGSPVDAGACTTKATPDPSKVSSTAARVCNDPSCSSDCAPGFARCAMTSGDVACPPGWPTRHSVGTALDVTCSACSSCSVSLDGGCRGTMAFFSDPLCLVAAEAPLSVDGTCAANSASDASVSSFKYSPTPAGITCTAGTSAANVALGAARTVCCP